MTAMRVNSSLLMASAWRMKRLVNYSAYFHSFQASSGLEIESATGSTLSYFSGRRISPEKSSQRPLTI